MEETKIINLTPHAITFVDPDTSAPILVVEPSGLVARVSTRTERVGTVAGIPLTQTVFGEVKDLPNPEEGVVYIVSSLVAQRFKDRDDVFIPNESVRDDKGRIIGCKSLGRV